MGLLEELKTKEKIGIDLDKKPNYLSTVNNQNSLAKLKSITSNTELKQRVNSYSASIIDQAAKQLQQNIIEIVFLLDKSSSCQGLEKATCKGYNQLIEKQKRNVLHTKVTTVLFNHDPEELVLRKDISKIDTLKYEAEGGTALYDTFCFTIEKIEKLQAMDIVKPTKTLVVIMTDGIDEHSKYYTDEDMKNTIRRCQNKGWEFLFLGALENAQEIAASLGINLTNSVESKNTSEGMLANFEAVSLALDDLEQYGKISSNWTKPIENINDSEKEKTMKKRIGVRNG